MSSDKGWGAAAGRAVGRFVVCWQCPRVRQGGGSGFLHAELDDAAGVGRQHVNWHAAARICPR